MMALPSTLDRFGAQLENAVRRDLSVRRRRRRMLRAAALSAVAAATALGLLSALPTGGPSVVKRAAAALQPGDNTILHSSSGLSSGTRTGASSPGIPRPGSSG
jgi:hypothetical protein